MRKMLSRLLCCVLLTFPTLILAGETELTYNRKELARLLKDDKRLGIEPFECNGLGKIQETLGGEDAIFLFNARTEAFIAQCGGGPLKGSKWLERQRKLCNASAWIAGGCEEKYREYLEKQFH